MVLGAKFTLRVGAYRLTMRVGACRLALFEGCGGVRWDAIVGRRAIGLYFLTLLSP